MNRVIGKLSASSVKLADMWTLEVEMTSAMHMLDFLLKLTYQMNSHLCVEGTVTTVLDDKCLISEIIRVEWKSVTMAMQWEVRLIYEDEYEIKILKKKRKKKRQKYHTI